MGEMIFLDSSFLVAWEVDKDQNYEKASKIGYQIIAGEFGDLVIFDYIFDETITVTFQKTKNLEKAVSVGVSLKETIEIIYVEEGIFEEAFEIFKSQKGTKFSFTDCTILALMKWYGIKNIATFDEDFEDVEGINVVC